MRDGWSGRKVPHKILNFEQRTSKVLDWGSGHWTVGERVQFGVFVNRVGRAQNFVEFWIVGEMGKNWVLPVVVFGVSTGTIEGRVVGLSFWRKGFGLSVMVNFG